MPVDLIKVDDTNFNYLSLMTKNAIKDDFRKYIRKELEYCYRVSSDEHFTCGEKIKCITNIKEDVNHRYNLLIAFSEQTKDDVAVTTEAFFKYIDNLVESLAK